MIINEKLNTYINKNSYPKYYKNIDNSMIDEFCMRSKLWKDRFNINDNNELIALAKCEISKEMYNYDVYLDKLYKSWLDVMEEYGRVFAFVDKKIRWCTKSEMDGLILQQRDSIPKFVTRI